MTVPLLEFYVRPLILPAGPIEPFLQANSMKFKNKVLAGFGTALLILILVGVLSYRNMLQRDEDRQWVTHTHQVLEKLDAVLTSMLDIETGARGYILAGEGSYLGAYNNALDQVWQNVKDVRELTVDNPVQRRAFDRLEPMISEGLEAVRHPIEIRTQEGLSAGAESLRAGPGKKNMDQI
jgi:CHASE3 domain sensor protein